MLPVSAVRRSSPTFFAAAISFKSPPWRLTLLSPGRALRHSRSREHARQEDRHHAFWLGNRLRDQDADRAPQHQGRKHPANGRLPGSGRRVGARRYRRRGFIAAAQLSHDQRRFSRIGLTQRSARFGQRFSDSRDRRAQVLRRHPSRYRRPLDQIDGRGHEVRHRATKILPSARSPNILVSPIRIFCARAISTSCETFVREPFVPESTMQSMVQRMVQVNMIDAKSAQSTPTSAYFDNSYVAELKQSGFLDTVWK